MKILTLICALIGVSQTYGNVVEWGHFSLIDVSGCPTLGYAGTALHTDTSISLKLTQSGGNLTIAESGYTSLVSFSVWTLAYASEIVASEMFEDEGRVYLWKGCQTGESFDVNASSDAFYLAFMTQLWKDDEFTVKDKITYGWVCVGVQDGVLTLLDSAIALDGSGLYVGGSVIPEPSSAMLLLLGCAGLLLKRRQRKFGGIP